MKRSYFLLCVFVILMTANGIQGEDKKDVLGQILSEVGFTRSDLGYAPKGYWARFPLDVPYKLTSFDDLFREPLKLYDYSRLMANAVNLYLDPAYADSTDGGLYKLVYNLGVDKKLGGFRSYSANLYDLPDTVEPWKQVVSAMKRTAEQDRFIGASNVDLESLEAEFMLKMSPLPDSVQRIIAELLVNLTDAIYWRNLAFRKCDTTDMREALEIRDLAMTQNDGEKYYPCLDDIARTIDWPSLHYAALKVAAASERASLRAKQWLGRVPDSLEIELSTPYGKVLVLTPRRANAGGVIQEPGVTDNLMALEEPPIDTTMYSVLQTIDVDSAMLSIDFGGYDHYGCAPGAAFSLEHPVSVVIDLDMNDTYGNEGDSCLPTAGVGLLGIGCVIDEAGDDKYFGSTYAQGAGLFGVGILLDRQGNDIYKAQLSAQGCGYFGIGLCLDGGGNDSFYIYGDGQGMGGVGGGIGVLADYSGDDSYIAEPDPKVFDRADYHSKDKINGNNAQGAAFGRRGDITDGHSWAGGLGAIIDIKGNDHYLSGNWSLGVGYWFSTGIAYDGSGNDNYESCYFTQGSGAHYCNGILIDEGGNDRHELYETAGAALGFGWDYTNAFLIDKGGDDVYRAKMISMGLAQIRSNAFLIDVGGNDAYYLGQGTPGLGEATFLKGMDKPLQLLTYYYYSKSFGGFIDIGGDDRYVSFNDTTESEHPHAKNNSLWLQPSRADSLFGSDNFGVGIDVEKGEVPELNRWDD